MNSKEQNQNKSEDLQQDLQDFKETKKSINDLINYRRSVLTKKSSDAKIDEYKEKAMDAINNLFSGDTQK